MAAGYATSAQTPLLPQPVSIPSNTTGIVLIPIRDDLLSILRSQWSSHVNINSVILCALFNFDSAYSSFPEMERIEADDWFTTWGTDFVHHYSLSPHDNKESISRALLHQRGQFLSRDGIFSSMDKRRSIMVGGGSESRQCVLSLWGGYLEIAKELTACVLALLELTASEAAVERSFSRQGFVHSKTRNRLSDESVQVHMLFSFNKRALQQSAVSRHEEDEEIADDIMDSSRGTALLFQSQLLTNEELVAVAEEEEEEENKEDDVLTELLPIVDDDVGEEHDVALTEEKKDMEESKEVTVEEHMQAVVVKFCSAVHVTQGFRWTGTREQQLQTLIIEAGLHVLTDVMKSRVKAHLAVPTMPVEILHEVL
jgi:hypothetical protein